MPLILRQLKGDNNYDQFEALMLYQEKVFKALEDWNGESAFKGYLYPCIRFVVAHYFRDIKPLVKNGECVYVPTNIIEATDIKDYLGDYDVDLYDEEEE